VIGKFIFILIEWGFYLGGALVICALDFKQLNQPNAFYLTEKTNYLNKNAKRNRLQTVVELSLLCNTLIMIKFTCSL
jgi:hypothetical protein